jgi:signal transduction histidine kinase
MVNNKKAHQPVISEIEKNNKISPGIDNIIRVMKSLSDELDFEKLLKKIITILDGLKIADKIILLYNNEIEGKLFLEYGKNSADNDIISYRSTLYTNSKVLPIDVISESLQQNEIIGGSEPFKSKEIKRDKYLESKKPQSFLCLPINYQGELIGMLYLENNTSSDMFSPQLVEELKIIASQTGISLKNTKLYNSVEKSLELEKLSRRTEESYSELKNELISNISLELNTRLNAIIGITETLLKGTAGKLTEDVEYNLSLISSTGKQLSFIANDILDFSKLETTEIVLRRKPVNLKKIANYVESLSNILIGNHPVKFRNKIDRDIPLVFGDENKIQFVLYDLVNNAIKYTKEGTIIISANVANELVEVSVTDTGIGMTPERRETIFKKISDVKTAAKRQGFSGFSLAIDKYLVELHRGTMQVESKLNEGSRFSFTIPVFKEKLYNKKYKAFKPFETSLDPETDTFETENSIEHQGIRILVVDDEPLMAQLIKNYFALYSYNIEIRLDGYSALKAVQKGDVFDLIILDIMMPDISGLEVARRIRQNFSLFELPILIITARNQIADLVEGFEAGANDYLLKPFDGNELVSRAKTLIKLRRLTKVNLILQEAIELKNQFINMTVHDLKNPLNVIQGISVMLKDNYGKESEQTEMLSLIHESSTLMSNLINELLENAHLESGKLAVNKSEINMNDVVREVVANNKTRADNKEQLINFSPGPDASSFINGDNIRLHEIIDNLLSNAIKFSPKGKTIHVSVKNVKPQKRNSFVRCEVKDEGPGLSGEDMKKLFGKFQRLSAQPTAGESSTGLGLSIVKQLVELHDGTIWAESEYGKGTTFIVQFPAKEPDKKEI